MSTRESRVKFDGPNTVNQEGDRGPIPQQLNEAIELISSANRRIEDCAVEWQAKISQAQWRILDKKPSDNKSWEESVLARTYFTDKKLDDAFQELLKQNKNFTDHLENFFALIRGELPTVIVKPTRNAQNQCSDYGSRNEEQIQACSSLSKPLDLQILENHPDPNNDQTINSANPLIKVQKSFTNLIKAKIDFDTKFLGFEATLNGNSCATSDPSINLYQNCSKVLGCGKQVKSCKSPRISKTGVQQYTTRRSQRLKQKRLRARKYAFKNKDKNLFDTTLEDYIPNIPD